VLATAHELLCDEPDATRARESQIDGIIRSRTNVRRKPSDLFERLPPEHRRARRPDEVPRQPLQVEIRWINLIVDDR
jgi:hypothetical protein